MTGKRRKARENAVKILYQMEMQDNLKLPLDTGVFTYFFPDKEEKTKEFCIDLVKGVLEHCELIDRLISKHSLKWKIERINCIDRNIIRVAIYEIWFLPEIPPAVSINEAIEIGKKYSSEDSSKFINGVLHRLKEEFEKT